MYLLYVLEDNDVVGSCELRFINILFCLLLYILYDDQPLWIYVASVCEDLM